MAIATMQPSTSRELLGLERTYRKHRRTAEFDPFRTSDGNASPGCGRAILLRRLARGRVIAGAN